jgi:hypothetical protein
VDEIIKPGMFLVKPIGRWRCRFLHKWWYYKITRSCENSKTKTKGEELVYRRVCIKCHDLQELRFKWVSLYIKRLKDGFGYRTEEVLYHTRELADQLHRAKESAG